MKWYGMFVTTGISTSTHPCADISYFVFRYSLYNKNSKWNLRPGQSNVVMPKIWETSSFYRIFACCTYLSSIHIRLPTSLPLPTFTHAFDPNIKKPSQHRAYFIKSASLHPRANFDRFATLTCHLTMEPFQHSPSFPTQNIRLLGPVTITMMCFLDLHIKLIYEFALRL